MIYLQLTNANALTAPYFMGLRRPSGTEAKRQRLMALPTPPLTTLWWSDVKIFARAGYRTFLNLWLGLMDSRL